MQAEQLAKVLSEHEAQLVEQAVEHVEPPAATWKPFPALQPLPFAHVFSAVIAKPATVETQFPSLTHSLPAVFPYPDLHVKSVVASVHVAAFALQDAHPGGVAVSLYFPSGHTHVDALVHEVHPEPHAVSQLLARVPGAEDQ